MRNDVIMACKYIARHTVFNVQACYSEKINDPDKALKEFEGKAYDLIRNATDADIEEAYEECLDCCEECEITAELVLRAIGDRAETEYNSVMLQGVNVIKEV